jgi:hypothetical protein
VDILENRCLLAVLNITVSGTAKWSDPAGGTHAIPLAMVEIRSTTEANTDPPLEVTQTTVNGTFSYNFNFDTSGGAQIFARIDATNPAAQVEPDGGGSASIYSMDTTPVSVTAAGAVALPEKDGSNSVVAEQSFGILGAALQDQNYGAYLLGGGPAPSRVTVCFPIGTTNLYQYPHFDPMSKDIFLPSGYASVWDTIDHEYGHYFADANGIFTAVGGQHGFNRPAISPKNPGLAWNEGWATFFGISAQLCSAAPYAQNVPDVDDTVYNDPVGGVTYNLALQNGLNELDEASVASALYHLTVGDEGIKVQDTTLFQELKAAHASTFGAAYDAIAATMGGAQRSLLGHVLAIQNIVPSNLKASAGGSGSGSGSTSGIPTFTWQAADPSKTDDFIIQFYTSDYKRLLYTTPDLGDVNTFTPTAAQWSQIFSGHATVKWFVELNDTTKPPTPGAVPDQAYSGQTLDRYWSEAQSLDGPSIGIVLDVTGSMQPEIDAVEAALVEYITNLQNSLSPDETAPTIDLVTFRNYPVETISSNDLDAVKAAIQSQVAEGGGDIPEPSAQSLVFAANNIGPGATLLLITDAPSDAGTDLDGTIAQLRAMGDTVNADISGDYGYDDSGSGSKSVSGGTYASSGTSFSSGSDFADSLRPSSSIPPSGSYVAASALTIGPAVISADDITGDEWDEPPQGAITDPGQVPTNDAGDTVATASLLKVDGPVTRAFIGNTVQNASYASVMNNDDYYAFNLTAGTSYNIPVLTDGHANVSVTLYDTNGTTQVATRRTVVGDPGFGYVTLTFDPKVSGAYFLDIHNPSSPTAYSVQVSDDPLVGATSSVVLWTTVAADTGGEFLYEPQIESEPNDPSVVTSYQASIVNVMDSTFEPTVLSASPKSAPAGTTLEVTLTGSKTNWIQGNSRVTFSAAGITVDSITVNSPTSMDVKVTVNSSAVLDFSDVTVTTMLGSTPETAFGSNALEVTAALTAPTLLQVEPGTLARGGSFSVVITGTLTAWDASSTLSLGDGVTVTGVTVVSPTEITATAQVAPDASIGFRTAKVVTADTGKTDTEDMAFTLTASPVTAIATVASISPAEGELGQHETVLVVGQNTNFVDGETTADLGNGVTVDSVSVGDSTHATVTIDVTSNASIGFRDVTLTTGAETATQLDAFQIQPVALSSPAITGDPASQTVATGQMVSFTAAASGNPAPTVQWQLSTDGGATFTDIAGATSPTFTIAAVAGETGDEYRAVFTNSQGTATSTTASLTVTAAPVTLDNPPTVNAGPSGTSTTWASFTRIGSFQDITGSLSFTATVNYGDGSRLQPLALNGDHTFDLSHVYAAVGTYVVTVSIMDSAGLTGSGQFLVAISLPSSGLSRAIDGFVTTLYHDVLARAPEAGGLDYWSGQLKKHLHRPTVVRLFFSSKERRLLASQGKAPKISYGQALSNADKAAHDAHADADAAAHLRPKIRVDSKIASHRKK